MAGERGRGAGTAGEPNRSGAPGGSHAPAGSRAPTGEPSGDALASQLARIGERIRKWREQEGLTLQALGRRAGVATSTVHKIETAQMIPSVAVLLKVARGLGRRPAELVQDGAEEPDAIHVRASRRREVGAPGRMLVERLSGDLFDPVLDMWRVTLYPDHASGTLRYEGEEILVCERGRLSVRVGAREFALRAGDSLHLKASIPHSWSNRGSGPARFTVTGTLPHRFHAALHERLAAPPRAAGPERPR